MTEAEAPAIERIRLLLQEHLYKQRSTMPHGVRIYKGCRHCRMLVAALDAQIAAEMMAP